MKDVLSVVTFVMGALCFVLFLDLGEARCAQCSSPTGRARALQTNGFS